MNLKYNNFVKYKNYHRLMNIVQEYKNETCYLFNYEYEVENMVTLANKDIENWYNSLNHISKNPVYNKFDSENYYNDMMTEFKIDEYTPIEKPNERQLRREVGCIKENKILEKIFKDRKEKRINKGKEFIKKWDKLYDKYLDEEQKNKEKYEKYKKDVIKEYKKENKDIITKEALYEANDNDEINEIIEQFISKMDYSTKYGIKIYADYNNGECVINIQFPKYDDNNYFMIIKKFKFIKSRSQVKGDGFDSKELEEIYETYVYNLMLLVSSKIMYFLKDKIKRVIINCYSKVLNKVNGEIEDVFFVSSKYEIEDINFSKIDYIDAKSFITNQKTNIKYPMINYNKIKPLSIKGSTTMNVIDNEIDGFAFEKLSKQLLEKNGFNDVEVTKASGDYGADVIAHKDGVKYAIQCKKYSSPVGVKAIQEVIASKSMYHCHVAVVLTNNTFTPSAIKLAESNGVLLWDKNRLEEMIKKSEIDKKDNNLRTDISIHLNSEDEKERFFKKNDLDLEDWQQELVDKGEYDPENFEEEVEDEDDYYYEDE